MKKQHSITAKQGAKSGFYHCRTCYDHLAGYVGVTLTDAMETQGYLKKSGNGYDVTNEGWEWFSELNISKDDFDKIRRPMTRQCIDGTERRPHLAGALGDKLLEKMLEKGWFKRVPSTRELAIDPNKRKALQDHFGIAIKSQL